MSSIFNTLSQVIESRHRSLQPLDLDGAHPMPDILAHEIEDIGYITTHGSPFSLQDLPAYVNAIKHFNDIDDRKLLLEKLLVLMSRLPADSEFSNKLQDLVIEVLYKDLPHPPASYLALPRKKLHVAAVPLKGVKYAYRSADGSDYNILFPSMGQAGLPYARTTPSMNTTPLSRLPDPALVFDTLLRRTTFTPHPGGLSSLFFAFANLIIHSIFDTNHRDWTINNASSYLDLSVLYGSSEQQVDAVRKKDGSGKLWEDVFADGRLLYMSPSTAALLVLMCRNHNYIADKLLTINENGTFVNPSPKDPAASLAQDDEIFHRARLVNSGYFVQIILRDYVGAILGLIRDGFSWRLDPLKPARQADHETFALGEGNVVSAEFNLLYRWHATTSMHDEQYTEGLFKKLFPGKKFDDITTGDFTQAARKQLIPDTDVKKWTFGGLTRDALGRFNDEDIAALLQKATEESAGAFKARGTPSVLRVIEILGIEQARSWGIASLNEFRKFMGLKPYASFADWNSDPEIHRAAAALYHDIDNLEAYVGMQAEETKIPIPGAGLCPGYTISRAILADAVCLTRGDRFLTVDFTPFNLTAWGYNDCQFNENDGAFGGMLSKLLFRHLPDYYPPNSAYGLFPFMVPNMMKEFVAAQPSSSVDDYVWTRPVPQSRPSADIRIAQITKYPGVVVKTALFASESIANWRSAYRQITTSLIRDKSITRVGSSVKYLDVVKDVINLAPVHWIAHNIMHLPLKDADNPSGVYREQEMFAMFANVANYVFVNADMSNDWNLRSEATKTASVIEKIVVSNLRASHLYRIWEKMFDSVHTPFEFMKLTSSPGASSSALVAGVFAETVATAALYSRRLAHMVDYFLGDEMASVRNGFKTNSSSDAEIVSLIRDALRSNPSDSETCGMLTPEFFEQTAAEVLRVILTLPDVRRVPGKSGQLGCFRNEVSRGVFQDAYMDMKGQITPWPVSLMIQYDQ